MPIWRQLFRGLRALTNRRAADRDIADEVESYLEQAAEALEANGMSPNEARRSVRLHLGNATTVRTSAFVRMRKRHLSARFRCAICCPPSVGTIPVSPSCA